MSSMVISTRFPPFPTPLQPNNVIIGKVIFVMDKEYNCNGGGGRLKLVTNRINNITSSSIDLVVSTVE